MGWIGGEGGRGLTGCGWGCGAGGGSGVGCFGRGGGRLSGLVGGVFLFAVEETSETSLDLGQGVGSCGDERELAVRKWEHEARDLGD